MTTIILLTLTAAFAWFFYTDRRNTVTATKTFLGLFARTVKEVGTVVKVEADIAKTHNDIADTETDRLEKFAQRNAERMVRDALDSIGLDKEFKASQATRLSEAKDKLEAAKIKAASK